MQKKFLTNLALLLFLNLLIKPFWIFGIDLAVQNRVGLEDYGFYFTIFNFSVIFNILLDAGITNFNNRNIAQHGQLLRKHFSGLMMMRLVLAGVYLLVIFISALAIGYSGQQMKMLAWVGFNQLLLSFILFLRSNVNGMLMFRTDSVLSVLDRLLMIAICAVLLWGNFFGGEFRIEWFVYAQTAAYLITAAMAFFIVLRRAGFGHFHWNLPFFLVILRKSLPFALLSLLMAFYNRADSVFIERLLDGSEGERQSGIYSQAFRLLDAFNQIAWLFAVLLLPIYSRMIRFRQPLDRMVRLPFSILFTTGLIVSITSFFFRHEIMMWLYPQNPAETAEAFSLRMSQSVEVYGILMFGFLGSTTMYVFSTLLTANGSLKSLNLVAFGGLLVNFSLNLVLIPVMLAKGAAIASLVTQLATAGAYVAVCQSRFRFKPDYRYIGSLILFAGIVTGASLAVKAAGLPWVQAFLIALAGSVAAAFSLRLVSPAEILRMLRGSDKGDGEYDHTGT